MIRYTLQRLAYGFITLFLVVSLTFLLLQFMPGSPFNEEKLTEEQILIINEKYGLNDPIPVQYVNYMKKVFVGDLGLSFHYDSQEVAKLIKSRIRHTVKVGVQALLLGTFVGIFLGAIAALKKGTIWDSLTILIAILGVSIPGFVIGTLLQFGIGVELNLLPVFYEEGVVSSTVMPTIALAFFVISTCARYMRTELVEVLGTDYILLARAKGLTRAQVVYKHAIRNALIPVLTILGPLTLALLTGGTVIERVFGIPGLGLMMVESVNTNDYFVTLGVSMFYSLCFITIIIIVDILYGVIDPRIRLAGGGK
ncbi:ABC transporter permease [Vallitalea okinawensis]|uniref:ABC transporter permease n=1 Tax=Vallitalea okinawensis TaxID=2078660 RepID=UPI000CFCF5C0|nr:ABC transporter permease [Vallitalea okinawensis]